MNDETKLSVPKESTQIPSDIFFFTASILYSSASFTISGSFLHLVAATTVDVIMIKMTTDETDAIMIFCFLVKFLMSNLDLGGLEVWFSILAMNFTFGLEASDSTSKMRLLESKCDNNWLSHFYVDTFLKFLTFISLTRFRLRAGYITSW